MALHHFEDRVGGYDYASLATFPPGHEGVIYAVAAAVETSPPWGHMAGGKIAGSNSWIEGCWNLQRRAAGPLPGLVLGTVRPLLPAGELVAPFAAWPETAPGLAGLRRLFRQHL